MKIAIAMKTLTRKKAMMLAGSTYVIALLAAGGACGGTGSTGQSAFAGGLTGTCSISGSQITVSVSNPTSGTLTVSDMAIDVVDVSGQMIGSSYHALPGPVDIPAGGGASFYWEDSGDAGAGTCTVTGMDS